eukprot:CAMPEP_0118703806 /NCGR_PEP_ID=MMETSP0800-20121206/18813_1 /TAXON_ID=210618 ORGANISM="Striatella unipunctata, Strain CCMP2910" /NCGR_SAMPLE_ID=MMETSP0800 /ASSEMBLY_ACC=CAM_ASM_000638 /LENGTH=116 /DNA_ID=CAMNT_0006605483 /DNA_START=195 /DNA_END=545 /DNA_ORIENTATION=+
MTSERVAILDSVGFVWDAHEVIWRTRVYQLSRYKQIHGNCRVPFNYAEDPQLATWVKCQRRQYRLFWQGKSTPITPERIKQLEQLGFDWGPRASAKAQTSHMDSDFMLLLKMLADA